MCQELTEIIDKQNNLIKELIKDNAEKENIISILMKEFGCKYTIK